MPRRHGSCLPSLHIPTGHRHRASAIKPTTETTCKPKRRTPGDARQATATWRKATPTDCWPRQPQSHKATSQSMETKRELGRKRGTQCQHGASLQPSGDAPERRSAGVGKRRNSAWAFSRWTEELVMTTAAASTSEPSRAATAATWERARRPVGRLAMLPFSPRAADATCCASCSPPWRASHGGHEVLRIDAAGNKDLLALAKASLRSTRARRRSRALPSNFESHRRRKQRPRRPRALVCARGNAASQAVTIC